MTGASKTGMIIGPRDIREGLLSTLSANNDASNGDRNARIAQFSVIFANNAISRDDPAISIFRRVGDRWSSFILAILDCGMFRHTELHRVINFLCSVVGAPVISQRVLTQKLRMFERDGLVSRTVRPTVPLRTEYRLTQMGAELARLVDQLTQWSLAHREALAEAQSEYDAKHADL